MPAQNRNKEDANREDASPKERSFGELARGLVNGTISRRKVMKLGGAAVLGSVLSTVGLGLTPDQARSRRRRIGFTRTFLPEEYSTAGTNPYFIPLQPGARLILEGTEDKSLIRLTITILDEIVEIDGVNTRVMEEREEEGKTEADLRLIEVSRNFIARGTTTNSVYYFGEDVDFYNEAGEIIGHEGAWRSGIDGARFGLLMPGIVLLGSKYFQEVAPGVALDRVQYVSLTEEVETPAGPFEECLKVRETTPLEPNAVEFKFYAQGVGLIQDGPLKLTSYEFP
jgi:hypothetical protein